MFRFWGVFMEMLTVGRSERVRNLWQVHIRRRRWRVGWKVTAF